MRRKTILNCLSSFTDIDKQDIEKILKDSNIDSMLRPDKISLDTYIELSKKFLK